MVVDGQVWDWAVDEFGGVDLGDPRRTKRSVNIVAGIAARPGKVIPTACGRGGAQSVSRFFNHKEVNARTVLSADVEQPRERCRPYDRVLAIQDTTPVSLSGRKAPEGLGEMTTSAYGKGLLLHGTVITTEAGTPLGSDGWSPRMGSRPPSPT